MLSNRPTQPSYGFGTASRDQTKRIYLSKEQSDYTRGKASPGPVYRLNSSVGPQQLSHNTSSPSYAFGQRSIVEGGTQKEAHPGPGSYMMRTSMGNQVLSDCKTTPGYQFDKSNRWSSNKSDFNMSHMTPAAMVHKPAMGWLGDASAFSFGGGAKRYSVGEGPAGVKPSYVKTPGPGTYQSSSSLGEQTLSQRQSSQKPKFGTSKRGAKLYVNKDAEREMIGRHSPGPNTYLMKGSIGSQSSSKNRSVSSMKFGSSDRFSERKTINRKAVSEEVTPGPGSYST